ncbi:unnamed protein product [Brassicogethes aeneus]|uniref:HPS5-like beta-propeller domain-containing protein n=1 Tax=Brassicogethes aeneus TaxID=1431903 RepID=A0A9P0F8U2_BRAAE|nr:unnamed protein product [Brassicogethes aeneus]
MAHENVLREWAPLTDLFQKLPIKSKIGLFSQEIKITCLDVLPEFLALGTNLGIVYWYDRKRKNLERLRCENANTAITVVKIISTVDYMVACGNKAGNISIFQVPKSHPTSLPENLKPKNKQVERYTVSDLHRSSITVMEWSKNGMKLFSGDKVGGIVLTELDFYMHICKSIEIINESYEVIQLSYNQQRLLVSTTYRSIICQQYDKWKICQVGKKDRKVLGNFGGIIHQVGLKKDDCVLYCTRPGLRIWISDIDGNVQKTLLFKELLSKECLEVSLINPISKNLRSLRPQKEPCFSTLLPFNDDLVITHNGDVIYILDPTEMIILYTISHLRGVLDIATNKDEFFVLEEDRNIIRISFRPEVDDVPESPVDNTFSPISSSIKDLTTKLQASSIMSMIPPLLEPSTSVNIHTDETLIMNAEEATESPRRNRPPVTEEVQKSFDDIGKIEFNNKILFKKTKKKKQSMSASTNSLSSNSSEEKDLSFTRPTIMNLSTVGVLPDLRSPESIKNDIEYKERILADVLNLDKVTINLDKLNEANDKPDYIANAVIKVKDYRMETNDREVVDGKMVNGERKVEKSFNVPIKPLSSIVKTQNTPDCKHIPNEWRLSDIQVSGNSASDTSLTDWEIL